jgi:hypothetical protein
MQVRHLGVFTSNNIELAVFEGDDFRVEGVEVKGT